MDTSIPLIETSNDLHHATTSSLTTNHPWFHIYRPEQAIVTCQPQMPTDRTTFYQLGYALNADCVLTLDGLSWSMGAGQLGFSAPGQTLSWHGGTGVWQGYSVILTSDFVDSSPDNLPFRRAFPFFRPPVFVSLRVGEADSQRLIDLFGGCSTSLTPAMIIRRSCCVIPNVVTVGYNFRTRGSGREHFMYRYTIRNGLIYNVIGQYI